MSVFAEQQVQEAVQELQQQFGKQRVVVSSQHWGSWIS